MTLAELVRRGKLPPDLVLRDATGHGSWTVQEFLALAAAEDADDRFDFYGRTVGGRREIGAKRKETGEDLGTVLIEVPGL